MISFHQFRLKEALSLNDPLAQSTLKIRDKTSSYITFEFKLDDNYYQIDISNKTQEIYLQYGKTLDELNLMVIYLKVNNSFDLTNQSGMKANIVYNMLLNAIKQANDHFGNNTYGYTFSGSHPNQDLMYDKLMKRFAPNLITWSYGIYLKPETIQKLKDDNPQMINKINEKIHFSTLDRQRLLQQRKEDKNQQRKERITP